MAHAGTVTLFRGTWRFEPVGRVCSSGNTGIHAELCRAGKLDPAEKTALQEHYRPFQDAIEAASVVTVCCNATGPDAQEITKEVHLIADHAKHVYAVGTRDIAALQYRLCWSRLWNRCRWLTGRTRTILARNRFWCAPIPRVRPTRSPPRAGRPGWDSPSATPSTPGCATRWKSSTPTTAGIRRSTPTATSATARGSPKPPGWSR